MLRCIPGVLFTLIVLGTWMFSQEISPKSLPEVREGQFVAVYDTTVTPVEATNALAVIKDVYATNMSTLGEKEFRVTLSKAGPQPLVRFEQIDLDQVTDEAEVALATFGQLIGLRAFEGSRVTVQIADRVGRMRTLNVPDDAVADYVQRVSE